MAERKLKQVEACSFPTTCVRRGHGLDLLSRFVIFVSVPSDTVVKSGAGGTEKLPKVSLCLWRYISGHKKKKKSECTHVAGLGGRVAANRCGVRLRKRRLFNVLHKQCSPNINLSRFHCFFCKLLHQTFSLSPSFTAALRRSRFTIPHFHTQTGP